MHSYIDYRISLGKKGSGREFTSPSDSQPSGGVWKRLCHILDRVNAVLDWPLWSGQYLVLTAILRSDSCC